MLCNIGFVYQLCILHKSWPFFLKSGICLPKYKTLFSKDIQVFDDKTDKSPHSPCCFVQELDDKHLWGQKTKRVFWGLQLICRQARIWKWLYQFQLTILILGFAFIPHSFLHHCSNRTCSLHWARLDHTCRLTDLSLKPWSLPLLIHICLEISTETKPSWWLILQWGPFESFFSIRKYI